MTIVGSGLESYIKRNARERALNRIAQAEIEAKKIQDGIDQRVRLIKEESQRNTEEKIEVNHRRMMAQAELEAQEIRLRRREVVLEELWAAVRERLEGLREPEQRLPILEHLIGDSAARLQGGSLVVQVNDSDRALLGEAVLARLSARLGGQGDANQIAVADEPASVLGGTIVRSQDGRRVVDNSWDERLRLAREILRDEAYRRLTPVTPVEEAQTSANEAQKDAGEAQASASEAQAGANEAGGA